MTRTLTTCGRCGGTGKLPYFSHVEGGVCFACLGRGTVKHRPSRVVAEQPRDYDFDLERLVSAARSWVKAEGSWEPAPDTDLEVLMKLASPEAARKARRAFSALGVSVTSCSCIFS